MGKVLAGEAGDVEGEAWNRKVSTVRRANPGDKSRTVAVNEDTKPSWDAPAGHLRDASATEKT